MTKLRVFLADDHPVFRSGLRLLINAQPDMAVAGEAADGEAAARMVLETSPDVAVLDVSMPGVGGIEAARRIRGACPQVRVLALSAHEDGAYARQMLAAGAAGYVAKRAAADDLVRAIRAVASGDTFVDLAVSAPPPSSPGPDSGGRPTPTDVLTIRQTEVLRRLARGHTIRGVAASLGIESQVAESDKARGMEKLGLKNRAELVRYAARNGWLEEE